MILIFIWIFGTCLAMLGGCDFKEAASWPLGFLVVTFILCLGMVSMVVRGAYIFWVEICKVIFRG